jgi:3-methyladenine DNA glycosylase AlkD
MTTREVLTWLEKKGTPKALAGMARYGIVARNACGVPMGTLQTLRKKLGTNHDMAEELWESGCYEARLLAALIGDPERVTKRQMDAWARGFENWADCDTVCFKLWDRSPHAWGKARQWSASSRELVKRGGFVLMACLAGHDKTTGNARFLAFLPLIEKGASDERNFVMKGVSWALRGIGRRNLALNTAAVKVARRLAESPSSPAQWIGRGAVRELTNPKIIAQLNRRAG